MKQAHLGGNSKPSASDRVRHVLAKRFSLFVDKAEDVEIERRIRDSVDLSGATPWILIFAIFVASVGLNVNSTAVIIGAMLISPLMGPIMGAGLGIAVYDFELVKRALFNLSIATLISLIVSALYFSVSPLHEAQSELLARTSPTIWDVLIAMFGGLAGIVGATRQEKTNIIPGVAIATALMPPVCTAGFGIATGQWGFVSGALYLYTINCVFIGLATVIGLRILNLKRHGFADERIEKRVKLSLLAIALGTAIPSAYLAIDLVKEEVFKTTATKFISQEFSLKETQIASLKIYPAKRTIAVALIGQPLNEETLNNIIGRLSASGLDGAKLVVHQAKDNKIDVASLKSGLLGELYMNGQEALRKKDEQIVSLQKKISDKQAVISKADDMFAELQAQFPAVKSIFVSEGDEVSSAGTRKHLAQLSVKSSKLFSSKEKMRVENWFKARIKSEAVTVYFELEPRVATRSKRK